MTGLVLLDAAGRRRSPATLPGYHCGRPPRNKGLRYPADPPGVEEIVAVMRCPGDTQHGLRTRALIVLLWRAELRISEALALAESDLDAARGSVLVRQSKGGKRREVGMDRWAWQHLTPWLEIRVELHVGALICVLSGPTRGRPWCRSRTRSLASPGRARRRATPLRAASTPPRARRRNGPRGRSTQRHPTPTRPRQPRHHVRLPARHRQQRNHRHRARPPCADASRQRRTSLLVVAQSWHEGGLLRLGARDSREVASAGTRRRP
jgi:Phage integrase family